MVCPESHKESGLVGQGCQPVADPMLQPLSLCSSPPPPDQSIHKPPGPQPAKLGYIQMRDQHCLHNGVTNEPKSQKLKCQMSIMVTSSWAVGKWKNTVGTILPPADPEGALCSVQEMKLYAAQDIRGKTSGSTQKPIGSRNQACIHLGHCSNPRGCHPVL